MPFTNCCRYIDQNIMPFADFLHSPTSFPITKNATKSYCGILLSFIMICILIGLSFKEIKAFNDFDIVTYSQDFIKRNNWNNKNITLGFNISKEWEDKIEFQLIDSEYDNVTFKKCNENLIESNNGSVYCIINYTLKVDYNSSHVLKLSLKLKNNYTNNDNVTRIPFTLLMREPKINHSNFENPLDTSNDISVERYRCFFDTKYITSFRRNLKLIVYKTKRVYFDKYNDNSSKEGIYLDDFEDTRKLKVSDDDYEEEEEKNLVGSY